MSAAEMLLPRLEGVRRPRAGCWTARCPAHDDRGPSLSVRELDDGRVLLHCFAGCAINDVVAAVGLSLVDLFPSRQAGATPAGGALPVRRPWSAADLLRLAAFEATVAVVIVADVLARGKTGELARLHEAVRRLADMAEVADGRR